MTSFETRLVVNYLSATYLKEFNLEDLLRQVTIVNLRQVIIVNLCNFYLFGRLKVQVTRLFRYTKQVTSQPKKFSDIKPMSLVYFIAYTKQVTSQPKNFADLKPKSLFYFVAYETSKFTAYRKREERDKI